MHLNRPTRGKVEFLRDRRGVFRIITLPSEGEMIASVESSDMPSWGLPDIIRELGLWLLAKIAGSVRDVGRRNGS